MKIEIDTANVSDMDRAILRTLLGSDVQPGGTVPSTTPAPVAEKPKRQPKVTPAPAADETAAAAPAQRFSEPEVPTSEEDGITGEDLLAPADPADPPAAQPTMNDAVAAATPLISGGKANEVKAVLAELGVKRVSELPEDKLQAFLDGISKL